MYFDEDVLLDLRFNYLNNYVDKFVIVESKYAHNGKKRSLNFDINNFENENGFNNDPYIPQPTAILQRVRVNND